MPEQLALFGDKAEARALAARGGVPLVPGGHAVSLEGGQGLLRRSERRGRDDQGDRIGGGGCGGAARERRRGGLSSFETVLKV